jgi:hypothetical protein
MPSRREPSARVALHGAGVADGRLIRVLAGGSARPALVQQIPASVEGHAEISEPLPFGFGDPPLALTLPELVFLLRYLVDPCEHIVVVHLVSHLRRAEPSAPGLPRRRTRLELTHGTAFLDPEAWPTRSLPEESGGPGEASLACEATVPRDPLPAAWVRDLVAELPRITTIVVELLCPSGVMHEQGES